MGADYSVYGIAGSSQLLVCSWELAMAKQASYGKVFGAHIGGPQMVEAQVTWTDGERFVGSASSGHAIVIDSDRERNTATGPMELVLIGLCETARQQT